MAAVGKITIEVSVLPEVLNRLGQLTARVAELEDAVHFLLENPECEVVRAAARACYTRSPRQAVGHLLADNLRLYAKVARGNGGPLSAERLEAEADRIERDAG